MKLRGSISTRVAAYGTIVLTAVGLAVTYVVYTPHQRILEGMELERLRAISQEQHNQVIDAVARLREDVQFLAATPPLAGIARARAAGGVDPLEGDTEAVWRARLQTIFMSFIRRRPHYAQVRFIEFGDGGRELVRVDRVGPNLLKPVTGEDLQRKGDTDYIEAARILARDVVFLSKVNLNREYDRVALPHTPTLRAATAVAGPHGVPLGAIVINQDLRNLFDNLERGRPRGSELYLTNAEGDYLIDTATRSTFGFDLGRPRRLQADLPRLESFFDAKSDSDRLFVEFERASNDGEEEYALQMTKIRFDPADQSRYLALGLYSSYGMLRAESAAVGRKSALAAALLVVVGSLLVFGYVRRLLKPLALVAASTDRVAAGEYDLELPSESDDEIGQLSRSFRTMAQQIEERNRTLEERARKIEEQQARLLTNARLEASHREAQARAVELERTSRHKSEFLARMSHDLRTPLNSMLILAKSLAENREGNLTQDQREAVRVLSGAGADLLALLNDLLDLSKVESGKLEVVFERTSVLTLIGQVRSQLQPLAESKGIELRVELDPDLPKSIVTDPLRLRQILSNLLSNALKFTEFGSVTLVARRRHDPSDSDGQDCLALAVADTGPGIPAEQIDNIFSPYRRLDRDVRSGPGGTGLGLAIVKELTAALGGDLKVESRLGEGSRFEVRLPLEPASDASKSPLPAPPAIESSAPPAIESSAPQPLLLAPPSVAANPESPAPEPLDPAPLNPAPSYAAPLRPESPPRADQPLENAPGAPRVLIADDDSATRWALARSLRSLDSAVTVDEAAAGLQALEAVRNHEYRCVVLDFHLPGLDGVGVLRALAAEPPAVMPRILLYTGRDLDPEERREVESLSASLVPKDGSLDAILDTARLALRPAGASLSPGRRLLLVEDDLASLFALGRELARHGAVVEEARNGLEAIEALGERQDIDAVLMDIRMPVMDGYEAIRRIRLNPRHRRLPVLALTADATREDRERCLAAGATEFVVKPVDPDMLVQKLTRYIAEDLTQSTL